MAKEADVYLQHTHNRQMSPIYLAKEAYLSGKRGLLVLTCCTSEHCLSITMLRVLIWLPSASIFAGKCVCVCVCVCVCE